MRLVTELTLLSLTTVAGVFAGFQTPNSQPTHPHPAARPSPILADRVSLDTADGCENRCGAKREISGNSGKPDHAAQTAVPIHF